MKVTLDVEFELPKFPNFLTIKIPPESLDEAFASEGGKTTVDVKYLSGEGLENFIEEWAEGFRKHVAKRQKGK